MYICNVCTICTITYVALLLRILKKNKYSNANTVRPTATKFGKVTHEGSGVVIEVGCAQS